MMMRHGRLAIAAGWALLVLTIGVQSIQAQQVSTALASKAPEAQTIAAMAQANGRVRIIVQHQASGGPGHRTLHTSNENVPLILEENRSVQDSIVTTHFGAIAGLAGPDRSLRLMEITPAFAINATAAEIDALANDPRVLSIAVDKVERPILIQSVPLIGMTSAYSNYNATGTGFAVAIIDSGVDKTHTFLANVILEACYSSTVAPGLNGTTNGSTSVCPGGVSSSSATGSGVNCNIAWSGCEHGTHVAGIAAGNNTQFQSGQPSNGVAKSSGIIAIKVASEFTGSDCGSAPSPCIAFWDSDMQAALDHVYAIRNSLPGGYQGVASANMSIGGGDYPSSCDSANLSFKGSIDNLLSANIATVVAAGNDSMTNQISFPACISSAIAVASSSKNDVIAAYSNINSQVAVFAPGGDFNQPTAGAHNNIILSSVPAGYSTCSSDGRSYSGPNPSAGGTYCYLAGTSMAAPHVAGAFAAIRSALPNATVAQILSALESTGISITDTRSGGTVTKPRIRVDLALQALGASSGTLQVTPTTNISSSGQQGGPFSPSSFNYTVSTTSGTRGYSITGIPSWLTASSTSGTVNTTGTTVTFSTNSAATALSPSTYSATITFTDTTSNTTALTISATLTVNVLPGSLQVTPATNMASIGNPGGPFSPSSFQYQLSATAGTVNYSISGLPSWLSVSSASGSVTTTPTTIIFTINSGANSLAADGYIAAISFVNTTNGQGNQTRNVALRVNSSGGGSGPPAGSNKRRRRL
jgi:subtilisin family serine protease